MEKQDNKKETEKEMEKEKERELKMYFLVNMDLKMGKGKIASQVGHAVCSLVRSLSACEMTSEPYVSYKTWLDEFEPMVVLKATQKQIEEMTKNLNPIDYAAIHDAGFTQVAPMSLTVLGIRPMRRLPALINTLKLL